MQTCRNAPNWRLLLVSALVICAPYAAEAAALSADQPIAALLQSGVDSLQSGNNAAAIQLLSQARTKGASADSTAYFLAEAFLGVEEYAAALGANQKVTSRELAPQALYQRFRLYNRLGMSAGMREAAVALLHDYPHSREAALVAHYLSPAEKRTARRTRAAVSAKAQYGSRESPIAGDVSPDMSESNIVNDHDAGWRYALGAGVEQPLLSHKSLRLSCAPSVDFLLPMIHDLSREIKPALAVTAEFGRNVIQTYTIAYRYRIRSEQTPVYEIASEGTWIWPTHRRSPAIFSGAQFARSPDRRENLFYGYLFGTFTAFARTAKRFRLPCTLGLSLLDAEAGTRAVVRRVYASGVVEGESLYDNADIFVDSSGFDALPISAQDSLLLYGFSEAGNRVLAQSSFSYAAVNASIAPEIELFDWASLNVRFSWALSYYFEPYGWSNTAYEVVVRDLTDNREYAISSLSEAVCYPLIVHKKRRIDVMAECEPGVKVRAGPVGAFRLSVRIRGNWSTIQASPYKTEFREYIPRVRWDAMF